MSTVDLHTHSTYSDDGEFTPKGLVDLCRENQVKTLAIADHNSVSGVAEALRYGKECGVEVIAAIEMDCTYNGVNLHVVGYGIDYKNPIFNEIGAAILAQEQVNSKKRLELVQKLGIRFEMEDIHRLECDGVVTGEMIAEAAMQFDVAHENPLLQPYYPGGARSDNPYVNFYWDYCAQGKPAYVFTEFISLAKAVAVITENNGVPILAHPGNNIHEDLMILDGIIGQGVKGLEVYSSYHTPQQIEFYQKYAMEHALLMTCGSDFHGKTKPKIKLGSCDCQQQEEELLRKLKAQIRK